MTTASEFIKIARAEIGVREGRDSNGNWNNRVKYNAWYADKVNDNAFLTSAWCATFVSWVANKAGIVFISGNNSYKNDRKGSLFYGSLCHASDKFS